MDRTGERERAASGARGLRAAGAGPATPSVLRAGTVVGKYRIEVGIGIGGMGAVYRAMHLDLGVPFAVKLLAPDLAQNSVAEERFFREAVAASHVRHPHVVRVSDYGRDRGLTYFVMDYLEGEDLASVIDRTQLGVEPIANILLPVCSAIAETHDRGFVHRDLKPSNVFLARNAVGRVVPTLLDFGVAKALDLTPSAGLTREGAIVGTPHYHAPELLRRQPATARSDQYAVGVILYQCATGKLPFDGSASDMVKAIIAGNFLHPRVRRPDLPQEFVRLILRAMSERPIDRFDSVRALGRALLAFASAKQRAEWTDYFNEARPLGSLTMAIAVDASPGWITQPEGRPTRTEPWSATRRIRFRGRRWSFVFGTGLACAAMAAGLWALWPRGDDARVVGAKLAPAPLAEKAPASSSPVAPTDLATVAPPSAPSTRAQPLPERQEIDPKRDTTAAAAPWTPRRQSAPRRPPGQPAAEAVVPFVGDRPEGLTYDTPSEAAHGVAKEDYRSVLP